MTPAEKIDGSSGEFNRLREVVVYTRTGCMFCQQVQDMLAEANVVFRVDQIEDRVEQDRLCEKYAALSFPLVLAGGYYIGGFTHIVKLFSEGRLPAIASDDAKLLSEPPPRSLAASRPRAGGLSGYAALGEYFKKKDGK